MWEQGRGKKAESDSAMVPLCVGIWVRLSAADAQQCLAASSVAVGLAAMGVSCARKLCALPFSSMALVGTKSLCRSERSLVLTFVVRGVMELVGRDMQCCRVQAWSKSCPRPHFKCAQVKAMFWQRFPFTETQCTLDFANQTLKG